MRKLVFIILEALAALEVVSLRLVAAYSAADGATRIGPACARIAVAKTADSVSRT
jgi:hypothetical protein